MADFRVLLVWGIHGDGSYDSGTGLFTVFSGHDGPAIPVDSLKDFAFRDANNRIFKIQSNTVTSVPGSSFDVEIAGVAPQPNPVNGLFTLDSPAAFYEVGGKLTALILPPPPPGVPKFPTIATIPPLSSGFQPTSFLTDILTEDFDLGVRMRNSLFTPDFAETGLTTFLEPPDVIVGTISISGETVILPACNGAFGVGTCVNCNERLRFIVQWDVSAGVTNSTHEVQVQRSLAGGGFTTIATVSPIGESGNCSPLVSFPLIDDGLFQDHEALCEGDPGEQPILTHQYKLRLRQIGGGPIDDTVTSSVLSDPGPAIACVI